MKSCESNSWALYNKTSQIRKLQIIEIFQSSKLVSSIVSHEHLYKHTSLLRNPYISKGKYIW